MGEAAAEAALIAPENYTFDLHKPGSTNIMKFAQGLKQVLTAGGTDLIKDSLTNARRPSGITTERNINADDDESDLEGGAKSDRSDSAQYQREQSASHDYTELTRGEVIGEIVLSFFPLEF